MGRRQEEEEGDGCAAIWFPIMGRRDAPLSSEQRPGHPTPSSPSLGAMSVLVVLVQTNPTQRTLSPSPAPPRLNQPPSSFYSYSRSLLHLFLLLILWLLYHPRLATHCYLPPYSSSSSFYSSSSSSSSSSTYCFSSSCLRPSALKPPRATTFSTSADTLTRTQNFVPSAVLLFDVPLAIPSYPFAHQPFRNLGQFQKILMFSTIPATVPRLLNARGFELFGNPAFTAIPLSSTELGFK